MRLIPISRASEFCTGLLDEESQVAASVESMRGLVDLAAVPDVSARPIPFLTDDVGQDLARIAADQECDIILILLGWHECGDARVVRSDGRRRRRREDWAGDEDFGPTASDSELAEAAECPVLVGAAGKIESGRGGLRPTRAAAAGWRG